MSFKTKKLILNSAIALSVVLFGLAQVSDVHAANEAYITGKVVNQVGTPQVGTLVRADKLSGPGSSGSAVTGSNGRFTITVSGVTSATTYKVYPPPECFADPCSVTISINQGETKDVGTFVTP